MQLNIYTLIFAIIIDRCQSFQFYYGFQKELSIQIRKRSIVRLSNYDYDQDEITYRTRYEGDQLRLQSFIPQAERYSTSDWWHNLKNIRSSRLLTRLKGIISFNMIWSTFVYVAYVYSKGKDWFKVFNAGTGGHSLLGGALGLLLVFRTNSAYDRFWEGRKIWERLLSSLRDLGRMTAVYSDVVQTSRLTRILHLLCAFPIVLQEHTQGRCQSDRLRGLLTHFEIEQINRVTNRPYYIVNLLSMEIRNIPNSVFFTNRERLALCKYVDDISRSIGCCERIVQTPVPLTYARHTCRFLSLWMLTLPLCTVRDLGWLIVPFSVGMTWSLFGIQEIGMTIEEPFKSSLNLEVFATTIRSDLSDMLHISGVRLNPDLVESPALAYEAPVYRSMVPLSQLIAQPEPIGQPSSEPMSLSNSSSFTPLNCIKSTSNSSESLQYNNSIFKM